MSQTSSIKTLVIQAKDLIDLNKLKIEMNESIEKQINPEYIEGINIKDYFDTIGNGKVSDKNEPDYSRIFDRPNKPNYIDIGVSSTTSLPEDKEYLQGYAAQKLSPGGINLEEYQKQSKGNFDIDVNIFMIVVLGIIFVLFLFSVISKLGK